MKEVIALAGATGNLGGRIAKALLARQMNVTALLRPGTPQDKVSPLESAGVKISFADLASQDEVARALAGTACVISALQGLEDVIIDSQTTLLEAAIKAGVPRFIPSDFSSDFNLLPAGENRNFDLRRRFHQTLDRASISSTSIFNGAFAEVLMSNMPLLDMKEKSVGYWDNADVPIDFTTMDDTAAFTAAAAEDSSSPRALHIASFRVSPKQLAEAASKVLGTPFSLRHLGALEDLREHNKRERAAHPEGEKELFPSWQQTQYVQSMFSTPPQSLDNNRYPGVTWTSLESTLREVSKTASQKA